MKSLLSLAGGGSLVNLWNRLPAFVKIPLIFGAGVLAAAELNIDANHAWFANRIFGGQAAQGQAQMVDPADTHKKVAAGTPVSGAERMIEVQVEAGDADARTKGVYADAAAETEAEILAKMKAGQRITTTEALRLKDLQLKAQELRQKTAEADIKAAEATAAQSNAAAANYINGLIVGDNKDGDIAGRMMDAQFEKLWPTPPQLQPHSSGSLFPKVLTGAIKHTNHTGY